MANKASALHILVDDEKQANDILAQLNNGANFQELAKKFSNCPSKRNGGDLGEFNKGDMVPAFDKAVFSCELLQPYGRSKLSLDITSLKCCTAANPEIRHAIKGGVFHVYTRHTSNSMCISCYQ